MKLLESMVIDESIIELELAISECENFDEAEYLYYRIYRLAIENNKIKIIKWLISKYINVDKLDNYELNTACAVGSVELIKLLISYGANVNNKNKMVGSSTVDSALNAKNYDIISLLIDNGYEIKDDDNAVRLASYDKQYNIVKMLLEYGFDVNQHKSTMVCDYNPTPVAEAVSNNDIKMVKLLLSYGADITLKDKYGIRPYNIAVKNKNIELIELIKLIEPDDFHNIEEKILLLKKYKVPKVLLDILLKDDRKINLHDNEEPEYIVFNHIMNANIIKWKTYLFVDLLSEVDNYGEDGFLVWYPKKKCLATVDYEHDEFKELGSVKEFFKNPTKFINQVFE